MKHLAIRSAEFTLYLHRFKEWLTTVGYSPSMISAYPVMLQEFFHYCEGSGVVQIEAITGDITSAYAQYVQNRKNSRREGALSAGEVNRHIRVLQLFGAYVQKTENIHLPMEIDYLEAAKKTTALVLTTSEMAKLYAAIEPTPYGLRDRAMLAVYYGCGLRKAEGVHLDISDVLIERKLLYIRKAKNHHQRYVPLTKNGLQDMEQWIRNGRPLLLAQQSSDTALFISERGKRITGHMLYLRLKALANKAGIIKTIGLHTLRHSIATHLLQKGMTLENIALFLGHRCLDSTQLYTHLFAEQAGLSNESI